MKQKGRKEDYRCSTCGVNFYFKHKLEEHVYKEHPYVFFRNKNCKTRR